MEQSWKEKRELNEELTDLLCDFADAFSDLKDALAEMERINDRIIDVNVEHSDYLKTQQNKIYEFNNNLISGLKEAINE